MRCQSQEAARQQALAAEQKHASDRAEQAQQQAQEQAAAAQAAAAAAAAKAELEKLRACSGPMCTKTEATPASFSICGRCMKVQLLLLMLLRACGWCLMRVSLGRCAIAPASARARTGRAGTRSSARS